MTKTILQNFQNLKDLLLLSDAYKKELFKLKITDVTKHLD